METKTVTFMPHGLDSPEVRARLLDGFELVTQWRMNRINQRIRPLIPNANRRMTELLRSQRNAAHCIPEFWRVVDELMRATNGGVACKRGCSHCCHIAALITQDEADVIGKRIGRKARRIEPPGRTSAKGFDSGYHNPCTFLVDGECSIYENRPLVCRTQYSLDVDALLCELGPGESPPVPYLNPHMFNMAFLQMLGVPDVIPVLGDIRDFFPKVEQ
jgi:Fe-S-cluster containining protein